MDTYDAYGHNRIFWDCPKIQIFSVLKNILGILGYEATTDVIVLDIGAIRDNTINKKDMKNPASCLYERVSKTVVSALQWVDKIKSVMAALYNDVCKGHCSSHY